MLSFEVVVSFCVGVATTAIGAYMRSYLTKKGENLATREDITDLTKKVEDVKAVFSRALQRDAQEHELSMAAIDKRLEVHQEAFARSFQLYFTTHDDDGRAKAAVHLQWWREHCLYLSESSSAAFVRACTASALHGMLLKAPNIDEDKLAENWAIIDGVWDVIAADVKLPQLGAQARGAKEVPPTK
jgi:hypothetical protein